MWYVHPYHMAFERTNQNETMLCAANVSKPEVVPSQMHHYKSLSTNALVLIHSLMKMNK